MFKDGSFTNSRMTERLSALLSVILLLTLFGITESPKRIAEAQTTYNPFTGNLDYTGDSSAFEYRADYSGGSPLYEGWARWYGSQSSTSGTVWRISKNTFDGANKIHTTFAGTGDFLYSWDSRSGYFAEGFLLLSDGASYILLSDGTSKILVR